MTTNPEGLLPREALGWLSAQPRFGVPTFSVPQESRGLGNVRHACVPRFRAGHHHGKPQYQRC